MAFDLEHIVDLALFARVVEAQSFSEAARRTGIAKSAVSRRIALLEQRLGVQLLRRSTRAVQVTTDGARFYEHCAQVAAAAVAAEDAVSNARASVRGLIRLSAPVTFSHMYLAKAVAGFQLKHPDVEVQLVTNDQFVDPIAGEFDLIVRITHLQDASFVAKKLTDDRLVVVGERGYLDQAGRPERSEDLVHHNCLRYALMDARAEWRFLGVDHKALSVPRGNFTSTDGATLREAMLAGLGLAVMPYFMVARDIVAQRAEILLEGHRDASVGIYAVVASARGLPLRVRSLIEHLQRVFSRADWRESHT